MTMSRKFVAFSLVSALLIASVVGVATAQQKPKVAMVVNVPVGDMGFGYAGWLGLQAVKKDLGAEISVSESVPIPNMVEVLRDYASRGYDVVIGHGVEVSDGLKQVSPQFPKVKFWGTFSPHTGPNLAGAYFRLEEIGFLAGALAAMMSKTGKVAAVGGVEIPPLRLQFSGFVAGAKHVNPNIDARVLYTGSFTDVAKAKEAALAQIAAGVDVIHEIGDASATGTVAAGKEKGIFLIGNGADKNEMAPKNMISSTVYTFSVLFVDLTKKALAGQLEGKTYTYGLKEKALLMAPYHGLVPKAVADKIEQIKQDILTGKIKKLQAT